MFTTEEVRNGLVSSYFRRPTTDRTLLSLYQNNQRIDYYRSRVPSLATFVAGDPIYNKEGYLDRELLAEQLKHGLEVALTNAAKLTLNEYFPLVVSSSQLSQLTPDTRHGGPLSTLTMRDMLVEEVKTDRYGDPRNMSITFIGRENYPGLVARKDSFGWERFNPMRYLDTLNRASRLYAKFLHVARVNHPQNPFVETSNLKPYKIEKRTRVLQAETHKIKELNDIARSASYLLVHAALNKLYLWGKNKRLPIIVID